MKDSIDSTLSVVAICGSERAGGNTDQVLRQVAALVAARGASLETVHLREASISSGCGPCGDCNTRPLPCAQADGVGAIVGRMYRADAIVYAAPVHAFGTSSLMQQFLERAGVGHLRFDRPLRNKVALPIVTGRRYHHEFVYNQLVNNILLNRMILAVAGFPPIVHGGAPGSSDRDLEGLRAVEAGVGRLLDLATFLHRARSAGLDLDHVAPLDRNERITVQQGATS